MITTLQSGREATDEHAALTDEIAAKSARATALDAELARFAEFDPDHVERITASIVPVRDAANRWTDAIWSCQKYLGDNFGMESSTFMKQFEIPEDLDYVE
jgi:hypothetical protein